jgi:uncharacterized membrane protein
LNVERRTSLSFDSQVGFIIPIPPEGTLSHTKGDDAMRRGFEPMEHGFDGWFLAREAMVLVLLLVVVGTLVWLLVRTFASPRTEDPLRRAAARYAAGKIERVEFERIQRDLAAVETAPVPASAPATTSQEPPGRTEQDHSRDVER